MNKKHVFTGLAVALAMTMTLAGCSTEDTMSGDSMSKTLTISVKDGGFDGQNSKASKVTSRAMPTGDDGLGTDFTMNDQIGIFEVKDGKVTKSNVCYINDGSLWNASNTIQYDANATYFAYYPYISDDAFKTLTGATDMSSAVDATAATDASLTTDQAKAEKFFATLIDKWTPKTDQTKMEDYNASDLMVAKGTLPTDADGYTMSFTMNHEMGLCLTTLSPVTYRVDKTYSFVMWPDYKLSGDVKPCLYQNKYRYIVKPNVTSQLQVSADGTTYSVNYFVKTKGHYTDHVVGGKEQVYQMRIGDIFYENGAMTHAGTLNTNYKPIGLVGYIANSDNPLMDGYSHALVICGKPYTVNLSGTNAKVTDAFTTKAPQIQNYYDVLSDKDGIQRTKDLADVQLFKNLTDFTGSSLINKFNELAPLTNDKTTSPNSGWFLPVGAQLYAILNQLNIAGGGTDINLASQEKETFITSVTATGVQASLKKAFENLGEGYYQFVTNSNKYCFTTASWAKAGSNYGFSFKIDTNQLMGSTTSSDPIGYFPILAF
ncbi:fimbrillin family protein [Prevotella sp. AGR2160]|uniref:fimbrillin family protein n=1 Tax=Prevotella sp. AGR2160 TaxID=1280674 RepID=UPI00040EB1CF|nr:fimbrillin family protein [Prevotella sp. AGR2160]